MNITIEPVNFAPRFIKSLDLNRYVFEELKWLKTWEENDNIPYVSLSKNTNKRLFNALNLPVPESGSYFKPEEIRLTVVELIKHQSLSNKFYCPSTSSAKTTIKPIDCSIIDLGDYSGNSLLKHTHRLLNLIDWSIDTYSDEAFLGVNWH